MIYSVLLRMQLQEDNWITMGEDHRISWDIRDLIEASSGWSVINDESMGLASSLAPRLEKGIWELTQNPDQYTHYEILHGLGTIRETLSFYQKLLQDCKDHPFTELYGNVVV